MLTDLALQLLFGLASVELCRSLLYRLKMQMRYWNRRTKRAPYLADYGV